MGAAPLKGLPTIVRSKHAHSFGTFYLFIITIVNLLAPLLLVKLSVPPRADHSPPPTSPKGTPPSQSHAPGQ